MKELKQLQKGKLTIAQLEIRFLLYEADTTLKKIHENEKNIFRFLASKLQSIVTNLDAVLK